MPEEGERRIGRAAQTHARGRCRPIKGLAVERAALVATPPSSGRADPADTPHQIVVTFSTPNDLARLREAKGAEFIKASLSACERDDVNQTVAVTQSAGLFREGRVEALPPTSTGDAGRHRYRATFDDWLPVPQGSTTRIVRAADIGGGLCFSLIGGSMWLGRLWSDRIALTLGRPEATPRQPRG